jgi:hypothetical protein
VPRRFGLNPAKIVFLATGQIIAYFLGSNRRNDFYAYLN